MTKFSLLLIMCFITGGLAAQDLVKIGLHSPDDVKNFILDKSVRVNYIGDDFIIATTKNRQKANFNLLKKDAWRQQEKEYFFVGLPEADERYLSEIKSNASVLYHSDDYAIVCGDAGWNKNMAPALHGGFVRIYPNAISLPAVVDIPEINHKDIDPLIEGYVAEVDVVAVVNNIQHLQDYVTRDCYKPESIEAGAWIKNEYESMGLTVEYQDFEMPNGASSDNVIAVQMGVVNPTEFVIVGGHYDSINHSGDAPGADDNASGTSAVLEIARILSQYEFNKTIIYCAFSGEEYGLYGSRAYATNAAYEEMNILGYINMDMIGYLAPGGIVHTDIVAPASANELVEFYTQVATLYVPELSVGTGVLSGGNSDHTSFNNNGFMGIFPFEDVDNYSPYIHSDGDTLDVSVNSEEMISALTKASLASVATMSIPFNGMYPPTNLTATVNSNSVELNWLTPNVKDFVSYKVYRDGDHLTTIDDISETTYTDNTVANSQHYEYQVTAMYSGAITGESYPSNSAIVVIGLETIATYDFEDSEQNWTIANTVNGWQYGVSVDFEGNNTNYLSIASDDAGSGNNVADYAISPEINLSGFTSININFDYGFRALDTDFLKVLYRTSPTEEWQVAKTLDESGIFTNYTVPLTNDAVSEQTQIAFWYDDNNSWAWYAAVDNITITGFLNNSLYTTPNNLTLETVNQSAILTWEAVEPENFIKYNIYKNGELIESISNVTTVTYTDETLQNNISYYYYITAEYTEGESAPSNAVVAEFVTGVETINSEAKVSQNYPNPFGETSTIDFVLEKHSKVELTIYNAIGAIVAKPLSTDYEQGSYTYTIQASDFSEGVYIYKMKIGNQTSTKRFTVIK